jgi:hypothetical protein
LIKRGEENPLSTPGKPAIDTAGKQPSTEIGSPIQSITPLQFSRGNLGAEVVFIKDLMPISAEEMPPSEFFFSKKRREVVRREIHQRDGATVKKHRVLLDGQALEEEDFATEVAGSLGAFATTNQFSVDNLKEKLKQKDLLVSQLQDKIKTVEHEFRSEMTKVFEKTRAHDRQEIQQLRISLDEIQKKSQASEELVRQLQVKISLTEKATVDILAFQAQALEVHEKLGSAQRCLLTKIEGVQDYYRLAEHSLENICIKEKEATAARVTFQEVVLSATKEEVTRVTRLSLSEQTRGDIILKAWEANIVESKRLAREVKKTCEEAFYALDKESLYVGRDNISGDLGQIDITKNQSDFKASMEEAQAKILQLKQVDLTLINKWIVNPSLRLQSLSLEASKMEDKLPHIERKFYTFEANDTTEPSRLVVQFVSRCVKCIEQGKGNTSGTNEIDCTHHLYRS